MELIWVCITGGVIGFEPEDILRFEKAYKALSFPAEYWDYFNWYFRDELPFGRPAYGFSVQWNIASV